MNVLTPMDKRKKIFSFAELFIIVALAVVPLFATFPYRVNIFLSWEGAYRLSQGQIPYRDFGMPLGYMYWVVPAFFFKVFGAQMLTLVKAQVFLNIVSGIAFRTILKNMRVGPGISVLSVLLFCLSYSFFNFWPWYNHTVIVYQLVGLAFVLQYISGNGVKWRIATLLLGSFFTVCSFLTKQDGGGLALLLCIALLACHCIYEKKVRPLLLYSAGIVLFGLVLIGPFLPYSFSYWFNHGQPPHTARISPAELVGEFFYSSQWIKFYVFIILLLVVVQYRSWKQLFADKHQVLFLLLTLGILAEASILQVTSYTPPDNNIFFHSFSIAFILSMLARMLQFDFSQLRIVAVSGAGLLLWWSGTYWKYFQRVLDRAAPPRAASVAATAENVVNRQTYMIKKESMGVPMSEWVYCGLRSFKGIYMPKPTAKGIQRIMNLPVVKSGRQLKVLNMSELTPLAAEIPFALQQGAQFPLWYHLGVSMFNKEARMFEQQIALQQYDLVLFENIPALNNFYPFRVRDSLQQHYEMIDSFDAPRRGDTQGNIEVYVPKAATVAMQQP